MKKLQVKLKILFFSLLVFVLLLSIFVFMQLDRGGQITIGAKNCTEQHILAEILSVLIETHTDLKVVRRFNFEGTTICFNALQSDGIDVYFEYTGTAFLDILKEKKLKPNLYPYVKKAFEEKYNLIWLDCLGFANQYGLIVRRNEGVNTISDLCNDRELRIGFDPEFKSRQEYILLKDTYSLGTQKKAKLFDQVLLYFALLRKNVDVISGCSTDGRLVDNRFCFLEDDKHCFPAYEIAPIVRKAALQKFEEIGPVIALLKGKIDQDQMRHFNYQVEFEGKDINELAKEFVQTL